MRLPLTTPTSNPFPCKISDPAEAPNDTEVVEFPLPVVPVVSAPSIFSTELEPFSKPIEACQELSAAVTRISEPDPVPVLNNWIVLAVLRKSIRPPVLPLSIDTIDCVVVKYAVLSADATRT